MLKSSLIFGGLVLTLAMLFTLAACEGPMGPAGSDGTSGTDGVDGTNGTDGTDGADGTNGINGAPGGSGGAGSAGPKGDAGLGGGVVLLTGPISDTDLEAAFAATETTVILGSGVTSVHGEVPAAKTLRVLGDTAVEDGQTLTLKGGLVLYSDSAALHADMIGSTSGGLMVEGGGISGSGKLYLPVDTDGSASGYATYQEVVFANKEVGSTVTFGTVTSFAAPSAAAVEAVFGLADGPAAITVANLTGIVSSTIPDGKTLTLTGAGNTITDASFAPEGTVVNNGTVTVAFTTDTEVTNIFAYVDGNVTASGAITILTEAFTVPAGVDLSLTNASATFDTGNYAVTVEGTLTLNGVTAFTPANDVIVNGELVVDSSSGITFAGAVSGTGVIKAYGGGTITIGGTEYTTASANGIAAGDLTDAAAAIAGETALTNSAIDLTSTFGAQSTSIGSIALADDSATAILNGGDGSSGSPVTVSSGISLAGSLTGTGASGTDSTDLGSGSPFTLSLTGAGTNEVSIADDACTGAQKLGVIAFSGVQLQYGELIGPVLPAFHIGVDTQR
jgi:hypothetical protein